MCSNASVIFIFIHRAVSRSGLWISNLYNVPKTYLLYAFVNSKRFKILKNISMAQEYYCQ